MALTLIAGIAEHLNPVGADAGGEGGQGALFPVEGGQLEAVAAAQVALLHADDVGQVHGVLHVHRVFGRLVPVGRKRAPAQHEPPLYPLAADQIQFSTSFLSHF